MVSKSLKKGVLSLGSCLFVLASLICCGCEKISGPEYPVPVQPGGRFEYTYKGKTLDYYVFDKLRRLCTVRSGKSYQGQDITTHYPGNWVKGDVEIPSIAYDKDKVPYTVVKISEDAFRTAPITSITIPESVVEIDLSAFIYCKKIKSVHLPKQIKELGSVGSGAIFKGCESLESIEIPESVETIGLGTFAECTSLREIRLPKNLVSAGKWVFAGCVSLQSIYCPVEKPLPLSNEVFENYKGGSDVYDTATLYVPAQSVDAYRTTEPWCNFKTIRGYNP